MYFEVPPLPDRPLNGMREAITPLFNKLQVILADNRNYKARGCISAYLFDRVDKLAREPMALQAQLGLNGDNQQLADLLGEVFKHYTLSPWCPSSS